VIWPVGQARARLMSQAVCARSPATSAKSGCTVIFLNCS